MTNTTTITATPTKLRDGSWGVKVQGAPNSGDQVTVTTRAGKTWSAIIKRVVWANDEVSLCTTTTSAKKAPVRASRQMGSGHGSAARVAGYATYCTDRHDCRCFDCAS